MICRPVAVRRLEFRDPCFRKPTCRNSPVMLQCISAAFLRTLGVSRPSLVLAASSDSVPAATSPRSGLMRCLSRKGEGFTTVYDWFRGAAGPRRLGGIQVTPAMRRGTRSWLRSMCSAPAWWLCGWLSSVWLRLRKPAERWSCCPLRLDLEAPMGLVCASWTGLVPQGPKRRLLSPPPPTSTSPELKESGSLVAAPSPSPNLPGGLARRSAGLIGKVKGMFPAETGLGLRLCGRGLVLSSGRGSWA